MTPEQWHRVKELFESALERAPDKRLAFLEQACDGDEPLRRDVQSLLASYEEGESFMERPAVALAAESLAESEGTPLIGQTINHYQIVCEIGSGGMGEVYLAQDTRLGRHVALKLLPSYLSKDEDRLRRFEREARTASALNHPNVCVIHEVGETEDDRHYIAMEYVDGVTLRQHIMSAQMELSEVLDVAVQIASGLKAAHEVGIVHRDIKPENIMMRSDGYVKVLDFGLAKLTEQEATDVTAPAGARLKTDTGVVMGTSRYMSPEQARGLAVDARTDIWSLGVLIYEMVTGEAPFKGETTSDVIVSILDREPQPLERCRPAVPAELQEIVSKTLSKSREARYQTIEELAGKLKSLKQELEYTARNETAGELANRTGKQVKRLTSSAKYLISGIKRHQKAVAVTVAMLITVLAASAYFHFARSQQTIDSLAALPFVNVDADPNTEYLSDGITESLINSLSQLPDLKVISFSSVSRYRGQQIDPQAVARELGVRALLVGKVTQRGDDLLVSAELVDTLDNSHIWGAQYNRKLSGLLALQKEISREIAERLRLKLTVAEQQHFARRETVNPQAYESLLKGRFYWNKGGTEERKRAIEYYQEAIVADPMYALAYTELAKAYSTFGYRGIIEPKEAMPRAKAAAMRALDIDETLAEAHAWLAYIKQCDWDWTGAEQEFKRAQELNPNYAEAHGLYAAYLSQMQQHEQAIAEAKRAKELDPMSPSVNISFFYTLWSARQYDQAAEIAKRMRELDLNVPLAHLLFGYTYAAKGQYQEAINAYKEAMKLGIDNAAVRIRLSYAYAMAGQREEARAILSKLQRVKEYVSPTDLAILYAGLGEKEEAFRSLERAYSAHDLQLMYLCFDPHFDPLRSDPRFQDLVRRVGLPP